MGTRFRNFVLAGTWLFIATVLAGCDYFYATSSHSITRLEGGRVRVAFTGLVAKDKDENYTTVDNCVYYAGPLGSFSTSENSDKSRFKTCHDNECQASGETLPIPSEGSIDFERIFDSACSNCTFEFSLVCRALNGKKGSEQALLLTLKRDEEVQPEPPSAPGRPNLVWNADQDQIEISWTDSDTEEYYTLERTTEFAPYRHSVRVEQNQTSYVDTDAYASGTTWSYRVVAHRGAVQTSSFARGIKVSPGQGSSPSPTPNPTPTPTPTPSLDILEINRSPSYDFGSVAAGGSSSGILFTVTNTSSSAAAASVSGSLSTSDFRFAGGSYPGTGGSCGATLAAGTNCSVEVEFAPASTGVKSANLVMSYTNSSARTVSRAVTGTGTAMMGPPAQPTSLVGFPNPMGSGVMLTWADNASNEDGYEVYRSTTSGSGFTKIEDLPAGSSSTVDSTAAGDTFYYYVIAVNSFGSSAPSNEVMVVVP